MNSFLCLLPPCVFSFRWAWGLELVLRTPRVLEAAFFYKFGTELATRDWKSGRQRWLDMLRRACNFTAACPLGLQWKTRLSAANICICDSIVLSEDEISRWREPRTKLKCSFLSHGIMRNVKLGSPPTPPWPLWLLNQCSSTFFVPVAAHCPFKRTLCLSLSFRCLGNVELSQYMSLPLLEIPTLTWELKLCLTSSSLVIPYASSEYFST